MTALRLLRNDLVDLERTLTVAHDAYASATSREPNREMIAQTVSLLDGLAASVANGSFLRMDVSERVARTPRALAAINGWIDAAYRRDANVVPLEPQARKLKRSRRKRIPKAVRIVFASPSSVSTSIGRPPWSDESLHEERARHIAEQNLFRDVRPLFAQDIDQLRSVRKLRVDNAFATAHERWHEFEQAFDALLGHIVRKEYARSLPYGQRLADHVEQMLFECAASALEGDVQLFGAAATLAETASYAAILGPVATIEETGVWAAFHLT